MRGLVPCTPTRFWATTPATVRKEHMSLPSQIDDDGGRAESGDIEKQSSLGGRMTRDLTLVVGPYIFEEAL